MKSIPTYKSAFSRDFTLVNMEVWYRGEVLNDKIWTKEKQPFLPYIVFEKTVETINSFYDPRGIEWVKNLLLDRIKNEWGFLPYIEKNFLENWEKVRAVYDKKFTLNRAELCRYLDMYEKGYVWFEAAWWLWDMTEKEFGSFVLPDTFKKLRETTQDYVPKSETLIRQSLISIYPKLDDFHDVLRISEIQNNDIPNMKELHERKRGYYFTDDALFTGLSRADIEKKYCIKLETVDVQNVRRFEGQVAYAGTVSGPVRIVLNVKHLKKVGHGDILVSPMTLPDFLPAIQKSAALVTDEGGMLSHAAISAREMKKPCIIGTKIATKVLKDGDLVEVDADKGVVKILKRAKSV